jgi:hypothetical protein
MGYRDIVKITSFITDGRFSWPTAPREQFICEPYPASTLLVAGLADPAMLVEIGGGRKGRDDDGQPQSRSPNSIPRSATSPATLRRFGWRGPRRRSRAPTWC